ncbi:MAG: hypothetical protein JW974_03130 [Alphaproteobacteria bacterium]|nr:hypothetical protein [Alphaproteobacteria bacterium]MBN2674910.1 hypothetical protein [Alphaproteobacteria bacterium]
MFKKLKLKLASRRVEKSKDAATKAKKKNKNDISKFWTKFWNIVSWPIRATKTMCNKIWHWLRLIDLIGMINLTLLITIIVLFSVLIMNILGYRNKEFVLVASDEAPMTITTTDITVDKTNPAILRKTERIQRKIVRTTITLPLKRVSCRNSDKIKLVKSAKKEYNMYGDIIIDGIKPSDKLSSGIKINGKVYLQNMRKYTLPCDIHIEGDLLLRNVEMLKFCGDFTITGNIYISRNSSFGPIPKTAKLGGQIIF